jgi:hypothetical protein
MGPTRPALSSFLSFFSTTQSFSHCRQRSSKKHCPIADVVEINGHYRVTGNLNPASFPQDVCLILDKKRIDSKMFIFLSEVPLTFPQKNPGKFMVVW